MGMTCTCPPRQWSPTCPQHGETLPNKPKEIDA